MIASARAPVPVASVMVTTGAMYPAPPLTIVKPVMTPPATVAVTLAAVKAAVGRYASSMVTMGAVYPVPPSTTVTVATGPFGSGLNAQLPYGPK